MADSDTPINVGRITRQDIHDGLEDLSFRYTGALGDIDFLRRLGSNPEKLPSSDGRSQFKTLSDDIVQHVINNNDYDRDWLWTDPRVALLDQPGSKFLEALCLMVHPLTRRRGSEIPDFLRIVNEHLRIDDLALVVSGTFENRPVYGWQHLNPSATGDSGSSESLALAVRQAVETAGWLVAPAAQPIGVGGGANVYLCYRAELANRMFSLVTGYSAATVIAAIQANFDAFIAGKPAVAALKVPKRPEARLAREISALRSVSHPALVRVLAADPSDAPNWYVMEFHPGGALEKHRDEFVGNARLVLEKIRPVVEALKLLHATGRVHRDIKPNNIFISSAGAWVLGDLGIVHATDDTRLTESDHIAASQNWMPDWVHSGRPRNPQSVDDVFLVAKTIYAVISGKNPRTSQMGLRENKLSVQFNDETLGPVDDLLSTLLVTNEKDCTIQDGGELLDAIDRLLRGLNPVTVARLVFEWRDFPPIGNDNDRAPSSVIYIPSGTRRLRARARMFRSAGGLSEPVEFQVSSEDTRMRATGSIAGVPGPTPRPGRWSAEVVLSWPTDAPSSWYQLTVTPAQSLSGLIVFAE
ncbi:MAG: protein kinase [Deltaproteobacteria bacterium]|nr:protein kinase [Deltaproteobacteria bacterium]